MRDPGLREDRRVEIQVGLVVLVAALLLVAGIFWISGTDLGAGYSVYGTGPQAGQLKGGAGVYLSGVEVGSVGEVQLQDDLGVTVRLSLDLPQRLPRDTRGQVKSAGFIGAMMVELVPGEASEPLTEGDTIPLRTRPGLQDLAAEVGEEATSVMEQVRQALSDTTVEGIRTAATATASAAREIEAMVAAQRGSVDRLLGDLNRVSSALARATDEGDLEGTVARLDTLSARLADASSGLDSTTSALATITGRLERGEGTMGRMLTDDALYTKLMATLENLQSVSEEVGLLAQDLRDQPDRYLRELDFSVF